MRDLGIEADAALVLSEFLQLETTNVSVASLLYPLVGARVYTTDLPTGYDHAAAAVVIVIDSDMSLGGSSVSKVRAQLRCYGGSDDEGDAVSVSLAARRQLRIATNERVASGALLGATPGVNSGSLIKTPSGVRPFVLLYSDAVINPPD